MINLGGYDINSFYDSDGVSFLTQFLQQKRNIKGVIPSDDKIPNLDGTIQLLTNIDKEEKAIPIRIFNVQVKTLNNDYYNKNKKYNKTKYKYRVETKVFNIVKNHITSDPVLLFLVDTKNKKIFWFHVSIDWVLRLGITDEKDKTIYFDDEYQIKDFDIFYQELVKIHEKYCLKDKDPLENVLLTNAVEGSQIKDNLYDEWTYLDNYLCYKLRIMSELMYPNIWKYGIAYEIGDKFNTIGIYGIREKGKNIFVKDLCIGDNDCFNLNYYRKEFTDIRGVLNRQISNMINKFYKTQQLPGYCLPNIVLEEIIFHFLDQFSCAFDEYEGQGYDGVYYKNIEDLIEIKKIWNALILYEQECKKNVCSRYLHTTNVEILSDPLDELKRNYLTNRNNTSSIFHNLLNNTRQDILPLADPLKYKPNKYYELYFDVLCELEKRQIKVVSRPWRHKKYKQAHEENQKLMLQGFYVKETGYLLKDSYSNFKKLLQHLPGAYNFTSKQLWKDDYKEHTLNEEIHISFLNNNPSFEYTKITRYSTSFQVIIDETPEIEINNQINQNLKNIYAQEIEQSDFSYFIKLDFPLYSEIWYLINKEMWKKCNEDIIKPLPLSVI